MKIENKLTNQFTSLLVCCVALTALAISSDQIRRTAHASPLTETNCASLPGFVFKPADSSLAFAVSSTAEASAPEPASAMAMAAPPQPTYGVANVDGNIGEWDLANDFFANMYRAGKTDKEIESKLYLRYDCATKTLYALVLVVPGVTIITNPNNNDDHFIKIGNNNKLVDANDGDNGSPPDFRFVPFGSFTIGWEASANLNNPLDIDNLNVHTQVNHDGSQTSAVADRAIPLVLNCTTPAPCLISGPDSVCAGDRNKDYSGPAGNNLSYKWEIQGNATIDGENDNRTVRVDVGASGAFTLKLTVTDTQTKSSTTCSKTVTVNPQPAANAGPDQAKCKDPDGVTTFTLNGSVTPGSETPLWTVVGDTGSANATIVSPNNATTDVNVTGVGTVTLRLRSKVTCGTDTDEVTLRVNDSPNCSITGSNTVCAGSTGATYSGPGGSNLSYAWTIAGNGSINGANDQQNVNVTAGASGSFTLTLTVTNTQTGCSSVCAKTVTVGSVPDTTITAADAVCAGSTGNTASVPNAGQGATYTWNIINGTIINGQGTNSITWSAGSNTPVTLEVQITNGAQCSARGSKQLKVNPLPTCAIRGADAVCAGSTGNTYSGPSGANLSYAWTISGDGSINGASNAQNVNVNAGASGSFILTLTVTDTQTGCGSVCSKTVTVGSGPDTTITAADAVCAGSTGNTASVPSAGQGATYTWNVTNGTITNGQGTNSITWTAGATGPVTLQVQITTGAQCSGRGSKQLRVNPLPDCSINGPNTVCASSTGATYSGAAGANLSYAWSISGSGSISGASNQQNVNVTAGASGSFTLTLTVTNTQTGCSSVCTKTVSIGSGTNTTTITAPNSVCAGSEGHTASVPNAGQGATYAWTITNGTIASGQGTNSITWAAGSNSPVTLSIQVTSGSGCPARASKQVTVNPAPSAAAGPDQTKCRDADGTTSFTLTGSVATGSQTPLWTVVGTTGGAAATIVSPNNQTTAVNVTGVGTVTLRLRSLTTCGEAEDTVTLAVTSAPGATITSPSSVCASSTGNIASTPSAGQGATYIWTITNGTITGGQGTNSITWTAGSVGVSTLNVDVSVGGGCGGSASKSVTVTSCDTENKGPGSPYPDSSEASDQKAGSVLIYNFYTSSVSNPNAQDTRISITNISQMKSVAVHLFFVNGENCSVADSFLCLTENQTASFLASEFDPGVSGYLVAVAVDSQTGCPISFNCLIGDEYIKLSSGHSANLGAEAFSALFAGRLPGCDVNSVTANLVFDGTSGYNRVPRMLALSNIPSPADGNNTLLILNRIGGDLAGGGLSPLTSLFGVLYNDNEDPLSFGFSPGSCQFRATLSNSFPRTVPRLETHVPAGRSGWMRLWMGGSDGNRGILGAQINFNSSGDAGAFHQGHNLHKLTLDTVNTFTIPIIPPNCD